MRIQRAKRYKYKAFIIQFDSPLCRQNSYFLSLNRRRFYANTRANLPDIITTLCISDHPKFQSLSPQTWHELHHLTISSSDTTKVTIEYIKRHATITRKIILHHNPQHIYIGIILKLRPNDTAVIQPLQTQTTTNSHSNCFPLDYPDENITVYSYSLAYALCPVTTYVSLSLLPCTILSNYPSYI